MCFGVLFQFYFMLCLSRFDHDLAFNCGNKQLIDLLVRNISCNTLRIHAPFTIIRSILDNVLSRTFVIHGARKSRLHQDGNTTPCPEKPKQFIYKHDLAYIYIVD